MSGIPDADRWSETLLRKARSIHSEIGALQNYAAQGGDNGAALSPEAAVGLFRGHYALLDDLYLNQLPYALAAEGADFFLGYRGLATVRERAGLGQMSRLFGTLRTQIGGLARSVAQADPGEFPSRAATEDESEESQDELDLQVGCCLPGLCVGFTSPEGEAGEVWTETFGHLGFAARSLTAQGEADANLTLAQGIADPLVRDAALGALRKLFPHRDKGIEAIELRGRLFESASSPAPVLIDRAAWQKAGELLSRPLQGEVPSSPTLFTGRLLQIDYELRRFELREVEGFSDAKRVVRCAYPPALDTRCEEAAKKRIEVRGRAAFARGGKTPRLVEVEEIRILPE
ncbi:hypothetical protein SAMN05444156_2596 [Verrucomicrobium sp. GAS474]|uniref:hypothetical protein n=1 Tax=Verrucomicrobium sp. GAS474 TaxID=1882831 RepID=UPI00087A65A8|nr:hypothetical protein [Verrucomicrobium sp. GAS474]SDU20567.1 hypothetical protein SAMN05444156_2596 [Verrucomicrobium sp. GAS474]